MGMLVVDSNPFYAIRKILVIQAFVAVFIAIAAGTGFGFQAAQSALYGGLIAFVPNAYFAFRVSRSKGLAADAVLRTFYVGESVKLIFTAVLFVLVIQLPGIVFLPLFIGFVAVILVFWFALLMRSTF